MVEQRTSAGDARRLAANDDTLSGLGEADSVHQALTCLRSSERRLRHADAQRTDEVLTLLRAAGAHLERAVSSRSE